MTFGEQTVLTALLASTLTDLAVKGHAVGVCFHIRRVIWAIIALER